MKPLTTEQLKALKVDDWVWVVIPQDYENNCCFCHKADKGTYREILCKGSLGMELCLHAKWNCTFSYSDYGTKWLAYKNKEQAEGSNEIKRFAEYIGSKIAGHSDYHGDKILSALYCAAAGKEIHDVTPLEEKGEIVELPCIIEVQDLDTVRYDIYFKRTKPPYKGSLDFYVRKTREEAEACLKELQEKL